MSIKTRFAASETALSALLACAALVATNSTFASGDVCPCASDLDNDGVTDAADLAILLGDWGSDGLPDLNASGTTDAADLAILLGAWGPCAAPINDNCDQAILLEGEIVVHEFCNASATDTPLFFPALCGNDRATIGKDIWFRYYPPYPGKLIVHTYDSEFDTVLGAYLLIIDDVCICPNNALVNLALAGCSDDANGGVTSYIEFDTNPNDCINIRVGGYKFSNGDVAEGPGLLTIRPIKRGDRCDIPNLLPSVNHVEVLGTNAGDTWLQADLSSCALNDDRDEWYRFVMASTGTARISTCNAATDFDTTLAVYSDCNGPGDEIACNDDSPTVGCQLGGFNRKSELFVNAQIGEAFYIRVSGYQSAVGNFKLTVDID